MSSPRHRAQPQPLVRLAATLLVAVAGTLVLHGVAGAAITAMFVQNTITPAAISDDPTLANMQSWSLMVTCDGNWASAGYELTLPPGHRFYKHPLSSNTRPNPGAVFVFPALAFDTFVTAPQDTGASGAPAILGQFPEVPGQADFGGTSGRFSVSWGDLAVDPPGTFEIARFTWPNNVVPFLNPLSRTSQVNPDSTFIHPEPTCLGLLAAAGLLAMRRRCA